MNSSISENCHETASQEVFLRSCGFAQQRLPPESETDSLIGHDEDLVESHAIRFVSPPQSHDTVDLDEDAADPTVPVDEEGDSIALEKSGNLLPSDRPSSSSTNPRDERLETPANKKLKIPLRDVVKAIVTNSRNIEEEEEDKESCVLFLLKKGFNFPGPSGF